MWVCTDKVSIDLQDAETVRGVTKAEIQEFFMEKIHTASATRAKLVVQLFARGGSQPDKEAAGAEGKQAATVIEDVRSYKAGLVASAGARPARDVSEYEEVDAKL